uniref:Variant surface glycoprotein 1125.1450 n=1 Tax=Trypanosoma brucei TaxID=5691 RepID=A0A1J0R707_9TRYP|nr:variant surface glycoprotein 1125.1450 [Trypanosoma brucei]
MCGKAAELMVALVLAMPHVSFAERDIINGQEFDTLCGFFRLAQRIRTLLDEMKGTSKVDVVIQKEKISDILFGTTAGDASKMVWKPLREMDCGKDSGNPTFEAGSTLVRDIICLCERRDLQQPSKKLCYEENTKHLDSSRWGDSAAHGKTWDDLKAKCEEVHEKGIPTQAEFQKRKDKLKAGIKERTDPTRREHLYTYGGGKEYGLQTCSGTPTQYDGVCVLYPRGSEQDNASGIKWLVELERLVKEVEKITKDEGTSKHTKPSSDGEPSMDAKPNSNLKPSTEGGSPTERSDEPRENRNPDAQTTTTTETQTGLTTARPPEEQKSSAKIILQCIWVFLFWLFV